MTVFHQGPLRVCVLRLLMHLRNAIILFRRFKPKPEAVRHTSLLGDAASRRVAFQVQDIAHILALERSAIVHGVVQKRRLRLPQTHGRLSSIKDFAFR